MCNKHKEYSAKKRPKVDCLDCWKMYAKQLEGWKRSAKQKLKDWIEEDRGLTYQDWRMF